MLVVRKKHLTALHASFSGEHLFANHQTTMKKFRIIVDADSCHVAWTTMYMYTHMNTQTPRVCVCVFKYVYLATQYRLSQLLTILLYAFYNFCIVQNLVILRFLQSKTTYQGFYAPALKEAAAGTKCLICSAPWGEESCLLSSRGARPSSTAGKQLQTGVPPHLWAEKAHHFQDLT